MHECIILCCLFYSLSNLVLLSTKKLRHMDAHPRGQQQLTPPPLELPPGTDIIERSFKFTYLHFPETVFGCVVIQIARPNDNDVYCNLLSLLIH